MESSERLNWRRVAVGICLGTIALLVLYYALISIPATNEWFWLFQNWAIGS